MKIIQFLFVILLSIIAQCSEELPHSPKLLPLDTPTNPVVEITLPDCHRSITISSDRVLQVHEKEEEAIDNFTLFSMLKETEQSVSQ